MVWLSNMNSRACRILHNTILARSTGHLGILIEPQFHSPRVGQDCVNGVDGDESEVTVESRQRKVTTPCLTRIMGLVGGDHQNRRHVATKSRRLPSNI